MLGEGALEDDESSMELALVSESTGKLSKRAAILARYEVSTFVGAADSKSRNAFKPIRSPPLLE